MEKEFNKLIDQLAAEFPAYHAKMGIADFTASGKGCWFIELAGKDAGECECCHGLKPAKIYTAYGQATFADALQIVRDKVKEGGEI